MKQFKDFGITAEVQSFTGDKIKMDRVLNKEITIYAFTIKESRFEKGNGKCLHLQIGIDGDMRVLFSGSGVLMDTIQKIPADAFPFSATIVKSHDHFKFT